MRSIAPGLYRDGDPRGQAWEDLLEREIGSLIADPDGINAVDAKELNRRLFTVAQRLADDVMSLHLQPLLVKASRLGLKRRLQSVYAVGMVAFLELPYYFAWSFQSRDRGLQEQLRAWFLGERRHTWREKAAVLCSQVCRDDLEPRREAPAAAPSDPAAARATGGPAGVRHHDIEVTLITCSAGSGPAPDGAVDFRALAWRPSLNGCGPRWVVPPLVEVVDFLEEEGFTALHTDSTAGQGLLALAAARLLHLPLTGAVDPDALEEPRGRGDVAGRLRRRYLSWFYGRLDEAYAPTRAAARALVAGGVDSGARHRAPGAAALPGRPGRPELSPAGRRPVRSGPIPRRRAARTRACAPRAGSRGPSARRQPSLPCRPA